MLNNINGAINNILFVSSKLGCAALSGGIAVIVGAEIFLGGGTKTAAVATAGTVAVIGLGVCCASGCMSSFDDSVPVAGDLEHPSDS